VIAVRSAAATDDEIKAMQDVVREGMQAGADIVIFDPGTVRPLPHEVVHDFPTGP
jgi:hypothetical protein